MRVEYCCEYLFLLLVYILLLTLSCAASDEGRVDRYPCLLDASFRVSRDEDE